MSYIIQQITAEETWPVRHRVMWPDHPFDFIKIPNDSEGVHFGLFVEGQLIAVE